MLCSGENKMNIIFVYVTQTVEKADPIFDHRNPTISDTVLINARHYKEGIFEN